MPWELGSAFKPIRSNFWLCAIKRRGSEGGVRNIQETFLPQNWLTDILLRNLLEGEDNPILSFHFIGAGSHDSWKGWKFIKSTPKICGYCINMGTEMQYTAIQGTYHILLWWGYQMNKKISRDEQIPILSFSTMRANVWLSRYQNFTHM